MNTIAKVFGLKPPSQYSSEKVAALGFANPKLLIGLELEIEQLFAGLPTYMQAAGAAWNVVEDGSLRPQGQAWEFVSKPMPMESSYAELFHLLKKVLPDLTDVNYSDRTSVHVHTNVQDFTQEQLATLCLIYTCLEDVLFLYVNHFNVDKKKIPDGMCRDTNVYCVPWTQCRMNHKLIDSLIFEPGEVPRRWQKYSALNLIPVQEQGTVEWRHLHGTNDLDKLKGWLNIIGSMMAFSKATAFEDVIAALKQLNNVSTYQQFFTSILGNTIPYNDDYRALLAEGCLNAKYSLIDWEPNKKKGKAMKAFDKNAAKKRSLWAEAQGVAVAHELTDAEQREMEAQQERRNADLQRRLQVQADRLRGVAVAQPENPAAAVDVANAQIRQWGALDDFLDPFAPREPLVGGNNAQAIVNAIRPAPARPEDRVRFNPNRMPVPPVRRR